MIAPTRSRADRTIPAFWLITLEYGYDDNTTPEEEAEIAAWNAEYGYRTYAEGSERLAVINGILHDAVDVFTER
jgi:hypothetical protein